MRRLVNFVLMISIFLYSCKKNKNIEPDANYKKIAILKEIGFNVSKVKIEDSNNDTNGVLVFKSIEEAKAYFKPYVNKNIIYSSSLDFKKLLVTANC